LEKVRAEFSLTALAYNLRRVLNIVGLPKLIAALQAWKATLERLNWSNSKTLSSVMALDRSFTNRIPRLRKPPENIEADGYRRRRRKQRFHTVCELCNEISPLITKAFSFA
jgi:hypothetical protein